MVLKQDIAIVNEYTVPLPGGAGSRGGTPGAYITRYMARSRGGMAFGYGSLSLSDDQLRAAAADIQSQFQDRGHTVMKTVLSFDEAYLKRHGVIEEDFALNRPGDYRSRIDQMKLRVAITHGLDKMGRANYDDLRWVGVIQVDTSHVHCHLVMVDVGPGQITSDGHQRGMINEKGKSLLRCGVDAWLDERAERRGEQDVPDGADQPGDIVFD